MSAILEIGYVFMNRCYFLQKDMHAIKIVTHTHTPLLHMAVSMPAARSCFRTVCLAIFQLYNPGDDQNLCSWKLWPLDVIQC